MRHLDDGVLQAWLDGPRSGLDAAERVEVGRHLADCQACARRLEELEATSGHVEALLSTPDATGESVPPFGEVAARSRRARADRRGRPRWRAAVWAASVAAAIGVGWIASDLYRGADEVRTVADEPLADSGAVGVVAVIASPPDTSVAAAAKDASATASVATSTPASRVNRVAAMADDTTSPEVDRPTRPAHVALPATPVLAEVGTRQPDSTPTPIHAVVPTASPADRVLASVGGRGDSVSATTAAVRGRVTDESGQPLVGAQVSIAGTNIGTLTRRDGTFDLAMPRAPADSVPREVTLTARMIGYKQVSHDLAMRGGNAASADFRLPEEAIALEGLVVSAKGVDRGAPRSLGYAVPQPEADATGAIVVPAADSSWASWRAVDPTKVEAEVGFRPLTVPDLPVVRIDVGVAQGVALLRIVQTLRDGGRLELVEALRSVRFEESAGSGAGVSTVVRRGQVWVALDAPDDAERLASLLEPMK